MRRCRTPFACSRVGARPTAISQGPIPFAGLTSSKFHHRRLKLVTRGHAALCRAGSQDIGPDGKRTRDPGSSQEQSLCSEPCSQADVGRSSMRDLRRQALEQAGWTRADTVTWRDGLAEEGRLSYPESPPPPDVTQGSADSLFELLAELRMPKPQVERIHERLCTVGRGLPDVQGVARPCIQLLKAEGVKDTALRRIVCDRPEVLHLDITSLKRKIDFCLALGVRPSALSAMLERSPEMLEAPVFQIGNVMRYLRGLGVRDVLLPLLLERFPSVFLRAPEQRLVPIVEWFESLGVCTEHIAQLLEERPQVLLHTPDQLQPKVDAFALAGMQKECVARAIRQDPEILALDLETQITPTIKILQEHGLASQILGPMLAEEPGILKLNLTLEAEQSKIRYLEEILGRSVRDLHECPKYLTSRLMKIAPRAAFLQERKGQVLSNVPLRDVVDLADREWASSVANVPAVEFFKFKEDFMDEQAEYEFQSGEFDYFFRSSMP